MCSLKMMRRTALHEDISRFTVNVLGFTQYDGHILTRMMKKQVDRNQGDGLPRGTFGEYAKLLNGHTYLAR